MNYFLNIKAVGYVIDAYPRCFKSLLGHKTTFYTHVLENGKI